jgi:hypothetical protein
LVLANDEHHKILQDTAGILFLGTPHRGSQFAFFGKILAWIWPFFGYGSSTTLFKTLASYSEELEELDHSFLRLEAIRSLLHHDKIICFFETKGLSFLGVSVPEMRRLTVQ